jgi:hypothetical protein
VIFYEMLHGTAPFVDPAVRQSESAAAEAILRLCKLNAAISPPVAELIEHMLSRDPAKRPIMKVVKTRIAHLQATGEALPFERNTPSLASPLRQSLASPPVTLSPSLAVMVPPTQTRVQPSRNLWAIFGIFAGCAALLTAGAVAARQLFGQAVFGVQQMLNNDRMLHEPGEPPHSPALPPTVPADIKQAAGGRDNVCSLPVAIAEPKPPPALAPPRPLQLPDEGMHGATSDTDMARQLQRRKSSPPQPSKHAQDTESTDEDVKKVDL